MMPEIAAVAIGKNEGERFLRCLASLAGRAAPIVYVDSGSTDGSVEAARRAGAHVVELDLSAGFTAARARNAGLDRLTEIAPDWTFVQMLDGDCELQPGWIETGLAALEADDRLAAVCGRRREKFPEASIWNRLIDHEWATPVDDRAKACGGDALFRRAALEEERYDPGMIAGEEPEMCYRLRQRGWRIARLDAEMTLHDADLKHLSQVWKRAERAGHAYAESAAMHGHGAERFQVDKVRKLWVWAGIAAASVAAIVFLAAWPSVWTLGAALLLLAPWPGKVLKLWLWNGVPLDRALLWTFSPLPEAKGALSYHWHRLRGRRRGLIDYKTP